MPTRASLRGVGLMELLIGMSLLGLLMALAMPSFSGWIRDTQIRSTAETLRNGLHMARAEAVRRNARMRLQFTSSLDDSCQLSATGGYWLVNQGAAQSPAGQCGHSVSTTVAPFLVQTSAAIGTRAGVSLSATRSTVAFDPLGRQSATTNPTTSIEELRIDLGSTQGTCVAEGGQVRCLRLIVSPGGDIRTCDPARTAATGSAPDAMSC